MEFGPLSHLSHPRGQILHRYCEMVSWGSVNAFGLIIRKHELSPDCCVPCVLFKFVSSSACCHCAGPRILFLPHLASSSISNCCGQGMRLHKKARTNGLWMQSRWPLTSSLSAPARALADALGSQKCVWLGFQSVFWFVKISRQVSCHFVTHHVLF